VANSSSLLRYFCTFTRGWRGTFFASSLRIARAHGARRAPKGQRHTPHTRRHRGCLRLTCRTAQSSVHTVTEQRHRSTHYSCDRQSPQTTQHTGSLARWQTVQRRPPAGACASRSPHHTGFRLCNGTVQWYMCARPARSRRAGTALPRLPSRTSALRGWAAACIRAESRAFVCASRHLCRRSALLMAACVAQAPNSARQRLHQAAGLGGHGRGTCGVGRL